MVRSDVDGKRVLDGKDLPGVKGDVRKRVDASRVCSITQDRMIESFQKNRWRYKTDG